MDQDPCAVEGGFQFAAGVDDAEGLRGGAGVGEVLGEGGFFDLRNEAEFAVDAFGCDVAVVAGVSEREESLFRGGGDGRGVVDGEVR